MLTFNYTQHHASLKMFAFAVVLLFLLPFLSESFVFCVEGSNPGNVPQTSQSSTPGIEKEVIAGTLGGVISMTIFDTFVKTKSSPKPTITVVPGSALIKSSAILGGSLCFCGACFVAGCVSLSGWQNYPSRKGVTPPEFSPSVLEPSCWDNMLYLLEHPWILLLCGLEFLAFLALITTCIKSALYIFGVTPTSRKKYYICYIVFLVLFILVLTPFKPMIYFSTRYDSIFFLKFLDPFLGTSPISWEPNVWFYLLGLIVFYTFLLWVSLKILKVVSPKHSEKV